VRRRPVKPGQPAAEPQEITFDIRAALDRSALDAELDRLAVCLAGGFPLALAVAWLGGMLLIRRAVRPVEQGLDRERRFAGAASHELRTPLTALRGEIELTLRRERPLAQYVAALRRMEELVARMTGVVEGLLVLTRARAGHLLLGAGKVPLADLRQALADAIRLLPGHEQVELSCTAPGGVELSGDALLLALAIRNLVENALVHAPEGPVQVCFSLEQGGDLRCAVADHGPGIPATVLPGRNGAADPVPSTSHSGGVGLGLSITCAVVEAHAGRLVLANRPGAGGLATIYLPVSRGQKTEMRGQQTVGL
jgi:two-component system OmpR family sensor kinase